MPPKGKGEAKAKAKAAAAAAAAAPAGGLLDSELGPPPTAANASLLLRMTQDIADIEGNDTFADVRALAPLKISEGGSQSPFVHTELVKAIESSGTYVCGGNLLWPAPEGPLTAAVPLSMTQVDNLQKHYFQKPSRMPVPVKIAVAKDDKPMEHKGALFRLSPVELYAAMVHAVADDVRANVSQEILGQWRSFMLTVPFEFVLCEGEDDRHFLGLQLREDLAQNFASMRYSALMRIFDLEAFMQRKARTTGRLTAAACAELYRNSIKVSTASEEVSDAFVDSAMTIASRLLSVETIRKALIHADHTFVTNNPLDSVQKLQMIINKAKRQADLEWCILLLLDFHAAGALQPDQVTTRQLAGGAKTGGKTSYIDLLIFKKAVLRHLLDTTLEDYEMKPHVKSKLRDICGSVSAYRQHCGYSFNPTFQPSAKTFMAGWPPSATTFLNIIDTAVFGYEWDDYLRACIRNRRDASSLMESDPFLEELTACSEQVTAEAGGAKERKKDHDEDEAAPEDTPQGASGGIEALPSVANISKAITEDLQQKVDKFTNMAKNIVNSNCEIAPETLGTADMLRRLKDSAAFAATASQDDRTHRGIFFDPKVAGQCSSTPHLRYPPLRLNGDHYKGLIKSVLTVCEDQIGDRDLFFIFDAARPGNHTKFESAFTDAEGAALPRNKHVIHILWDENSCKDRRETIRGFTSINQTEQVLIISKDVLQLNEHKRLFTKGTNRGNVIGPLAWPNTEDQWCHLPASKKEIIGKTAVILVGGAAPVASETAPSASGVNKKDSTSPETVFYHAMPSCLYAECVHGYDLIAGIDLACGDGACLFEFVQRRRPCFGIALTQHHADCLVQYLEAKTFESMQDEKSPLFSAALVETLKECKKGEGDDEEDEGEEDEKGKSGKKRKNPSKKAKPTKKVVDDDDDDGEDGEGEGEAGEDDDDTGPSAKRAKVQKKETLLKKIEKLRGERSRKKKVAVESSEDTGS